MIKWIVENKEWIFSGIGVTILLGILLFIRKIINFINLILRNRKVVNLRRKCLRYINRIIKSVNRNKMNNQDIIAKEPPVEPAKKNSFVASISNNPILLIGILTLICAAITIIIGILGLSSYKELAQCKEDLKICDNRTPITHEIIATSLVEIPVTVEVTRLQSPIIIITTPTLTIVNKGRLLFSESFTSNDNDWSIGKRPAPNKIYPDILGGLLKYYLRCPKELGILYCSDGLEIPTIKENNFDIQFDYSIVDNKWNSNIYFGIFYRSYSNNSYLILIDNNGYIDFQLTTGGNSRYIICWIQPRSATPERKTSAGVW